MKLLILNKTDVQISNKLFNVLFGKTMKYLKVKGAGDIGLILVSDEEIKKLNKVYRGVGKTTDVLSFSYLDSGTILHDSNIGEICISVETAQKQAKNRLEKELGALFVHGLLHVFGFTHEEDEDEAEMEMVAGEILKT